MIEFYAIVVMREGYKEWKSQVKGHFIRYDAATIIVFLGLPFRLEEEEQSEYREWLNQEKNIKEQHMATDQEIEEA